MKVVYPTTLSQSVPTHDQTSLKSADWTLSSEIDWTLWSEKSGHFEKKQVATFRISSILGLPKDYKNRLDVTEFKKLEDNETQRTWSLGSSSATLSFGDTSDGFRTITLQITA